MYNGQLEAHQAYKLARHFQVILLLAVVIFPRLSFAGRGVEETDVPIGHVLVEGDMLIRAADLNDFISGVWAGNLWPNGIVPYQFRTNDGTPITQITRSDFIFAPGPPATITTAAGSFISGTTNSAFQIGDDVLVSGSNSNDNVAGTGYTIAALNNSTVTLIGTDALSQEANTPTVTLTVTRSVTATRQQIILAAMAQWEGVANVNFQAATTGTRVMVQRGNGNNSQVGVVATQPQPLNLFNFTTGVILHELGHALSFIHTQSRQDRNSFVTVNLNNVCQTCCINGGSCNGQFNINATSIAYPVAQTNPAYGGVYDYSSVMHYGRCAFSNPANVVATTTRADITFNAGAPPGLPSTVTTATGDFTNVTRVAGGTTAFVAGEELVVLGSTTNDAAAGSGYTIGAVSPTTITLFPGNALQNEAPGASVTLSTTCRFTCSTTPDCYTIATLDPAQQNLIGQRTALSFWDKKAMSYLYAGSIQRFLWAAYQGGGSNGSFSAPYTNISTALANTPVDGQLTILYPDTYSVGTVLTRRMVIDAPTGGVLLTP